MFSKFNLIRKVINIKGLRMYFFEDHFKDQTVLQNFGTLGKIVKGWIPFTIIIITPFTVTLKKNTFQQN